MFDVLFLFAILIKFFLQKKLDEPLKI